MPTPRRIPTGALRTLAALAAACGLTAAATAQVSAAGAGSQPPAGPAPDAAGPAASPPQPAGVSPTETIRLENGMTVLLRRVPGAEEAAFVLLIGVGDGADPEGRSGMGMLLERIFWTAAAGPIPDRDAAEIQRRYGGKSLTTTGEDATAFASVVRGSLAPLELAEYAFRLGALRIEPWDLEREQASLVETLRQRWETSAPLRFINQARELTRPSPAGARRFGVPEQVKAVTIEEARERARLYGPRNATLAVVGGFDLEAVRTAVTEKLAPLAPGDAAPAPRTRAPAERGASTSIPLLTGGERALTTHGYDLPLLGEPLGAEALLVVARLHRAMVVEWRGERPAFPPPVHHPVMEDPRVALVTVLHDPGETSAAASDRMDAIVAKAVGDPVTDADRQMLRTLVGRYVGLVETPDDSAAANPYAVAMSLARASFGGVSRERAAAAIDSIDDASMRRAGEAIFARDRRVALHLTAPDNAAPAGAPE